MIDFNDLIPTTRPKSEGVGILDFNDLIPPHKKLKTSPEQSVGEVHTPQPELIGPPNPWTPVGTPNKLWMDYIQGQQNVSALPPVADPFGRPDLDPNKPIGYIENIIPQLNLPIIAS